MSKLENFKFQASPSTESGSGKSLNLEREKENQRRFFFKLKRFLAEAVLIAANLCIADIGSRYVGRQIEESYFTADDYVQYVLEKEKLTEEEKQELKRKVWFTATKVGDKYFQLMKEASSRNNRNKVIKTKELELKGWQKTGMTGDEAERLKEAILRTYPSRLVKGTIREIVFREEFGDLPKEYGGIAREHNRVGAIKRFDDVIAIEGLNFTGKNTKEREKMLLLMNDCFAHELAHYHDWINNPNLTARERLEFLYQVLSRYGQPDAPSYSYESKIKNEEDKFLEQQLKIEEWWAESCDNYLNLPYFFIRRYPKEAALIERWLKIDRQEFDAIYNLVERADILLGRKKISDKK